MAVKKNLIFSDCLIKVSVRSISSGYKMHFIDHLSKLEMKFRLVEAQCKHTTLSDSLFITSKHTNLRAKLEQDFHRAILVLSV